MAERAPLLNLEQGDIVGVRTPAGTRLICVVTAVTATTIHTSHAMRGRSLVYDRRTGAEIACSVGDGSIIISAIALPLEAHSAMLAFDRNCRLGQGEARVVLGVDEKKLLDFLDERDDAGPLPARSMVWHKEETTVNQRAALLFRLQRDDLFHAQVSGVSLPCRVLDVSETAIMARRVTTQELLTYDRRTGVEIVTGDEAVSVISSVAPLPVHMHDAMLSLDRRNHLLHCLDDVKLARYEIDALVFIRDHYAQYPLPVSATDADLDRPRVRLSKDREPEPCAMCHVGDGEDPFSKTREELLSRLEPGDFFNSRNPNDTGRTIGVVLGAYGGVIRARMITSQETRDYDRRTGNETAANGAGGSAILSVAPLAPGLYNALVALDRRVRLGNAGIGLDEAEQDALAAAIARFDEKPLPA